MLDRNISHHYTSHGQARITPGAITPGHLTPWNVLWRYNTPEKDIGVNFAKMLERSALINESALMTPVHFSPSSPALESGERCNLPPRWSPFRTINIDPSAPRWLRHRGEEAPASMLNTAVEESRGPNPNRRLPLGPLPPKNLLPQSPACPSLGEKIPFIPCSLLPGMATRSPLLSPKKTNTLAEPSLQPTNIHTPQGDRCLLCSGGSYLFSRPSWNEGQVAGEKAKQQEGRDHRGAR